eukprot:g17246.t1
MSPKRNSARAKAAGAISGQRSKERVEKRAEKRPRAELIPRDSVRAIMHTFHVLTSRKDKPGGKGTRSRRKGAPSPKDDLNLLGCDVDTVMKAVDELEAGNLRRNPRQGRRRAMPRQKREQRHGLVGESSCSGCRSTSRRTLGCRFCADTERG